MATRLQKMILTLVCGTALGLARCQRPAAVEEPAPPPPDVAADTSTADAEQDTATGLAPAPDENDKVAMYGAPPPEDLAPPVEAQPMYGVPHIPPEHEDQPMYGVVVP